MAEAVDIRRREDALETACGLFMRFGYRKTSMDDISRAVGVSRQGLYLWFPNKEALFIAAIDHLLDRMRSGVVASLSDSSKPLCERILGAFDALVGVNLQAGMNAGAVDELLKTAATLVGDRVARFEDGYLELLAEHLSQHGTTELSGREIAEVLNAVSVGTKYRACSRAEYLDRMATALRAVGCGPS